MSAAKPTNRPGCYKCGQQGHWARDCQAPKEAWLPRDFEKKDTQQEKPADGGAENEQQAAGAAAAPVEEDVPMGAAAAARASRKRPKLTFDDLKKPSGLPELYHNFPEAFRRQFRGRGHEVADLRRLLEMYSRWQGRVFPHGSFDNFIASLEKIGAANVVKKEMSDMRMDLLRGVEDKLRGEREDEAAAAVPDEQPEAVEVQEEEPMLAIDSDEELLELAAMPMEAGAAVGVGAAEEPPPGDLNNDDELLAMAAMQDEEEGVALAVPPAPAAVEERQDYLDDDELLALADDL